ncbi:MAG: dTDP-4-dehydrorhamnose reductase [Lautropia sp. SCN 70-15]|nr:MAG: dTDP-4-dehydrorhamnose reductase [Lautropia sp. SCN 70-15]
MKILLTGATGQIGWELARSLQPLGAVVACGRGRADLAAPATLAALVESVRPQVIVNAAAYTAVDRAEQEPALADTINREAPGALAAAARRVGALLVHYSTDYVFDGGGDAPRREDARVAPVNAYGRSKLAGERAIANAGGDWLVLRTSWVYASRGSNFVKTMLWLGAERESLRVVADQVGAPTSARLIADVTAHIVRHALAERAQHRFASEILHLCAAGETSWHGFAQEIFDGWRTLAGADSLKLRELLPIPSSEYPTPAARPPNSRLDCSRLRQRFGIHLPDWREGVRMVLEEIAERAM